MAEKLTADLSFFRVGLKKSLILEKGMLFSK